MSLDTDTVRAGQQNNNKDILSMNVELNIFSGLANPKWKLSANQVAELLTIISKLNPTERSPINKDLGYNGFTTLRAKRSDDPLERIEVKDGIISIYQGNIRSANLLDPERTIELWLLRTAPNSIDIFLLKEIENNIRCSISH